MRSYQHISVRISNLLSVAQIVNSAAMSFLSTANLPSLYEGKCWQRIVVIVIAFQCPTIMRALCSFFAIATVLRTVLHVVGVTRVIYASNQLLEFNLDAVNCGLKQRKR